MLKTILQRFVVTVILAAAFLATASAQTVTKTFLNEPLSSVLKEIGSQTGCSFIYEPEDINKAPAVSASFESEPLASVLSKVLRPPFKFEIRGSIVIINREEDSGSGKDKGQPKSRTVTGTVYDMHGESVIGATVWIKGSRNGTIIDLDGRFSIDIPNEDGILCVSSLGYQGWELAIGKGPQTLNIVLKDEANQLEEVVVVGMNNRQTRRSITGAISTIQTRELTTYTSYISAKYVEKFGYPYCIDRYAEYLRDYVKK